VTQGSSLLATLGFEPESRWDSQEEPLKQPSRHEHRRESGVEEERQAKSWGQNHKLQVAFRHGFAPLILPVSFFISESRPPFAFSQND